MMRARSPSLIVLQRAISSMVRAQPTQSPERTSIVQILLQGLSIIGILGRIDTEHR